ncbi:ubiquinol-cytochrome c reductase complex protein [Arthroderma uncinatum]|uniref:ubiquinol-cytochrome c reductase complex protein n=1 Tax=Arthroderma uncinatum TaxID=74035 RepID=UPI00144AA1CC|nr:ubiquinol-cytochrome c reductase complex protein [Arthroderma uncinatum]KAF3491924.1 ubiquinol-cytochrome c reductase complex protein [Arthroderma uncinatum]
MVFGAMVNRAFEVPWVRNMMKPVASWYVGAAGYRKLGLRFDDLIPEENDTVQLALKRLPPKEAYDRIYRIRRAVQCSVEHQLLPEKDQTKPEEDVRYLLPLIEAIQREQAERAELDALVIKR